MIKNERQYKLTKSRVRRFGQALEDLRRRDAAHMHPVQQDLEMRSISGVIKELESSMSGLSTTSGDGHGLPPATITDVNSIPRALVEHRIAAGLSQQAGPGRKMGLKEQQMTLRGSGGDCQLEPIEAEVALARH